MIKNLVVDTIRFINKALLLCVGYIGENTNKKNPQRLHVLIIKGSRLIGTSQVACSPLMYLT